MYENVQNDKKGQWSERWKGRKAGEKDQNRPCADHSAKALLSCVLGRLLLSNCNFYLAYGAIRDTWY